MVKGNLSTPGGDELQKRVIEGGKKFSPASREVIEEAPQAPVVLDCHSLTVEIRVDSVARLAGALDVLKQQVLIQGQKKGGVGFLLNEISEGVVINADYNTPYGHEITARAYALVQAGKYPTFEAACISLMEHER